MSVNEPSFPSPRVKPLYGGGNFEKYAPVQKARLFDGRLVWLVTGHEDAKAVLKDYKTFARQQAPDYPAISPGRAATLGNELPSFSRLDPPEHTRLKGMIAPEFTAKKVDALISTMEEIIDSVLDEVEERGPPMDIFSELSVVLPTMIVAEMMGLPREDAQWIHERQQYRFNNECDAETARRALSEMMDYVERQFTLRDENGDTDDVIGRYIKNHVRTGNVSRDLAIQTIELSIAAGYSTTSNQIPMGLLTLLMHPDQMEILRQEPELIGSAVNEMLRYTTINQSVGGRVCRKEIEIAGQKIMPGDAVFALLPAANCDPSVYPEPDKFDIRRNPTDNLAFGFGIHGCMGQILVRKELEIFFLKLIQRFPNLRLAVPFEDIKFNEGNLVYGLRGLPVTW